MNDIRRVLVIIFPLFLISCNDRTVDFRYYPSGKIKVKAEMRGKYKDGTLMEYYENGQIKSRQTWKQGRLDGPFFDYFDDGQIYREGMFNNGKGVFIDFFYRDGSVERQKYDMAGDVLSIEIYNKDGSRDKRAIPYLYIEEGDTLQVNTTCTFKAQMINVVDSSKFPNPLLLIGKKLFGRIEIENIEQVIQSEVELLRPKRGTLFYYKFTPQHLGADTIFGEFVFSKTKGDTLIQTRTKFYYPYFVAKVPQSGFNFQP